MAKGTVRNLAKDLTKDFPRSPRATLGGYVIAARTLDKCRAVLNGSQGKYKFNCPLDRQFFEFTEIDVDEFKQTVESGVTDEDLSQWINEHAKPRSLIAIIKWNNKPHEMHISELPDEPQEFLETYIPECVPSGRPVYCWFDVYDLEEQRL